MLDHLLQRWPNIIPQLVYCLVFASMTGARLTSPVIRRMRHSTEIRPDYVILYLRQVYYEERDSGVKMK